MSDDEPVGVLFICHANLCRSPLAEGVFRDLARRHRADHRFRIDSAGTWAIDGLEPHPLSCQIASDHGFELTGRSRSIEPDDLRRFDHIVAMDRRNLADLQRYRRLSAFGPVPGTEAEFRLLRAISRPDAQDADLDVPDPIGHGAQRYLEVYELLRDGCGALLAQLGGE